MKNKTLLFSLLLVCFQAILLSCHHAESNDVRGMVSADSLCERAYQYRFVSLDSVECFASQALSLSSSTDDSYGLALCHLAFSSCMKGDFDSASTLYSSALDCSSNELVKLWADVGMMDVCKRKANNKSFYEYRNNAIIRMKRIREEQPAWHSWERLLWNASQADFLMISAGYYQYLLDSEKAKATMMELADDLSLIQEDTAQIARYCYMTGMLGGKGETRSDMTPVRALARCVSACHRQHYRLYEAFAMQALAGRMLQSDSLPVQTRVLLSEIVRGGYVPKEELPLAVLQKSQSLLREYGSSILAASAFMPISELLVNAGEPEAALDSLEKALEVINRHHVQQCYGGLEEDCDSTDLLYSYGQPKVDSLSTEMRWLYDDQVTCVPELMAAVRERLSVVYSAMGMKGESDFNRNVYLDILDATRQDMEMQTHIESLHQEEHVFNILLIAAGILLVLTLILLVVVYLRQRKKKTDRLLRLNKVLSVCYALSSDNHGEKDQMTEGLSLQQFLTQQLKTVYPQINEKQSPSEWPMSFTGYDRELLHVVNAFYQWVTDNAVNYRTLRDRMVNSQSEREALEFRIAEQKRSNVDKAACLSLVMGMNPYIDRMLNEIKRLDNTIESDEQRKRRLEYVQELIEKINLFNELLVHWIQVRQGRVKLHITNFSLEELFETFEHSRMTFENKGLSLDIEPTTGVVKADKALTMFMINTLLDNARKFTPEGGSVRLCAEDGDGFVEISVIDTGEGLSAQDVHTILDEKVYDASLLGNSPDQSDADGGLANLSASTNHKRNEKGFGFGLMNCKGIIEKYKKTSNVFSVCAFGIDSEKNKGSRFFFRLPKGVLRKSLAIATLMLSIACASAQDTIQDSHTDKANRYLEEVYYSNVDGYYEDALLYADSALQVFNEDYLSAHPGDSLLMGLQGHDFFPEIQWYKEKFPANYHLILFVRNEAAVAALALNEWGIYRYNNQAYAKLYRLLAEDPVAAMTSSNLQQANNNKKAVLFVLVFLLLSGLVALFLIYYRYDLLHRINIAQLLKFHQRFFKSSDLSDEELGNITIPARLIDTLFEGINDLRLSEGVLLSVCDAKGRLSHHPYQGSVAVAEMKLQAEQAFKNKAEIVLPERNLMAFPLSIEQEGEPSCVGVLTVVFHDHQLSEDEDVILKFIVQFISLYLYYSVIQINERKSDVELMEDEKRRAEYVENSVHVENMVLDNCLSTIKHETMYYPNRIKTLVENTMRNHFSSGQTMDFKPMLELVTYYRDIFSILSRQATSQLDGKAFKRSAIKVVDLLGKFQNIFRRLTERVGQTLVLNTTVNTPSSMSVMADDMLIDYLFECLIHEALEMNTDQTLHLTVSEQDRFVEWRMCVAPDRDSTIRPEEMFSPEWLEYDTDTNKLKGADLFICRQIIREHDAHSPARGCRIYAELMSDHQLAYVFTLPKTQRP